MRVSAKSIDEYLGQLAGDERAALEALRRTITSVAPTAEECISYQMPAFRINGRALLWIAAQSKHCAFYTGVLPIETHRAELATYSLSKGTIRFQPDAPLPAALVRKLVKTRIAEYAGKKTAHKR